MSGTTAMASVAWAAEDSTEPPPASVVIDDMAPWAAPTESLEATPAEILAQAGKRPRVLAVVDEDGTPVIKERKTRSRADARRVIKKFQQNEDVVAVEIAQPVELFMESAPRATDPRRGELWGLDRLRVESAWTLATGNGVKVAVIDTGVARHVDLPNIGKGADFVSSGGDGTNDGNGHGTHVAGTIAAAANNGIGVTGVAPDVEILPVRVLGDSGSGTSAEVAQGIIWAADNGANVINLSLGGTTYSQVMEIATTYAISRGVTVIASAGNSGNWGSPRAYPASNPGVIGVAATTRDDQRASFSTRNEWVDIAGPGAGILSTIPGDNYASFNGTSMAAPHVAGVAALVHERARKSGEAINITEFSCRRQKTSVPQDAISNSERALLTRFAHSFPLVTTVSFRRHLSMLLLNLRGGAARRSDGHNPRTHSRS